MSNIAFDLPAALQCAVPPYAIVSCTAKPHVTRTLRNETETAAEKRCGGGDESKVASRAFLGRRLTHRQSALAHDADREPENVEAGFLTPDGVYVVLHSGATMNTAG
ncbi:hypothetical protein NESM_000263300 [Novymonas esmeraldas]|uniref:Uncharacterized protein n=1 Tax=Novymonas esmeraldas TaxID=1808958 RepID=A0AAW0F7E3_9TRYP